MPHFPALSVFSGGDLCLHFPDQFCQLFLTLGFRFRVDIPGHALSIDDGGVSALPEVVIDLADTAGARLAALAFVGLEDGGRRVSWRRVNLLGGLAFDDPTVDLGCGSPLHLIGHMGIDVQRGAAGHMADDGRKSLRIHAVLQGSGGESMSKLVEAENEGILVEVENKA